MTIRTSGRVSGATSPRPLRTRETVAIETPARSAISRIVILGSGRSGTGSDTSPLKQVPERFGNNRAKCGYVQRLTAVFQLCNAPGTVYGKPSPIAPERIPLMRRSIRLTSWLAPLAGLVVLVVAASAPAATSVRSAQGHQCVVMTGSGDPAFVKNFNPYTATGLPSGSFVQGAMYEPLVVVGEGGLKPVPWLARSWTWSNGNKTLTLNIAKGVKWSDGKSLTAADVVYSLTAGRQDKLLDR